MRHHILRSRGCLWNLAWLAIAGAVSLVVTGTPRAEAAEAPWPSFRGPEASGINDGQNLPADFDVETGENVRWRVAVPGLAHSSPIVAGGQVVVTSAISSRDDADFKHGLYGAGDASSDRTPHEFAVMAFDVETGVERWRTVAHRGVPKEKRHIKATYANQTPATDGRVVVAFFGSEGLFGLDLRSGEMLWQRNLGTFDVGAYDAPTYEWGSASSPMIWQDLVFVQVDTQNEDFIMALDVATGATRWRSERDELPSWGTPNVLAHDGVAELVTNGAKLIRGYDPRTGEQLWQLGPSSKITAPTPISDGNGHFIVASGRRPEKPIFVIRAGARGDLTLAAGESNSEHIAWSLRGKGPYMPTPLALDGVLYVLQNEGIFAAYSLADGTEHYRTRIEHRGSGYSASPVAADGLIYLPSEDGDLHVVEAGPAYRQISTLDIGERLMATPAIADGALFVRGRSHLLAVARDASPAKSASNPN